MSAIRGSGLEIARVIAEAEGLSRRGMLAQACALLERRLRGGPDSRLLAERARHEASRRRFGAAAAALGRALKLSPRDPELHAQALDLEYRLGNAGSARRALERARRSGVDPGWVAGMQVRLALAGGRLAEARRALASEERRTGQENLLLRGCAALCRGERPAAARLFERDAARYPRDSRERRRALFYAAAARALRGARPKRRPSLALVGLGIRAPYSVTAGGLRALAGRDVVYNNVSGSESKELLSLLCAEVRPCTYDNKRDEQAWLARIGADLDAGKSVAFATRGHALVYGDLGARLVKAARARRVPLAVEPGLSVLEACPTFAAAAAGGPLRGLQSRDFKDFLERPLDPRRAVLLLGFDFMTPGRVAAAATRLARAYGRRAWLFGPAPESAPTPVDLRALAKSPPKTLHPSLMLFAAPR